VSRMIRRNWMPFLAAVSVLTAMAAGLYSSLSAQATSLHETVNMGVSVAPGYALKQVAAEFSAPTGAAVGSKGEVYVAESGRAAGTSPRVLKVLPGKNGRVTVAADFAAPLTGITWHGGKLYVSYAGGVDVLDPDTGLHHPVLTNLPARGDFANGAVVFGADGKLYFGLGTATNAGVIGLDNLQRGWVKTNPDMRDIPCKPVKLRGSNFTIANPLTPDNTLDTATTGAFSPFGKTTARLQIIPGAVPCTGAVLRANPDGTGLEMVAWGLRNPSGLTFGPEGGLYVSMQGFEDRGSRPVVGDMDYVYRIEHGAWYGWPDFAGGRSVGSEVFQKPSLPATPLLAEVPGRPPAPVATLPHGVGASGMLFPPDSFGLRGDALAALFGSTLPQDPGAAPPGHAVVRINPRTGAVTPFIRNTQPGPASAATAPGLERPVALTVAPRGTIYLVDYGQVRPNAAGGEPVAGTGVLWQISYQPPPKGK
jgi:glucose/arabinose dehydrogenase